ncbi:MAG TPA: methyltransferase domain-containing protein [Acidimicrobiales bacterium]|nr:methyltransferase domain-containing protein [Acidimicrobiales bacterium]
MPPSDHAHDAEGQVYDQAYWDERYRSEERLWSGRPNATLVDAAGHLPAGRALDVGCGEGADAIWLAGRGWEVLGVDISAVAIERAGAARRSQPGDVQGRVRFERRELPSWVPEPEAYDLVVAAFLHLPSAGRAEVWHALAAAVAPAGHLVVVAHDMADPHAAARLAEMPDRFFAADEVVGALGASGGFEVDRAGSAERPGRDGHSALDLIVHAVRRCA